MRRVGATLHYTTLHLVIKSFVFLNTERRLAKESVRVFAFACNHEREYYFMLPLVGSAEKNNNNNNNN